MVAAGAFAVVSAVVGVLLLLVSGDLKGLELILLGAALVAGTVPLATVTVLRARPVAERRDVLPAEDARARAN